MNSFYALEPRWLMLDRFCKIYVTDDDLRGTLLGRQVYDEDSARQMVAAAQVLGYPNASLVHRTFGV